MSPRFNEDLFVGLVGVIIEAVVYLLITDAVNKEPIFLIPLTLLLVTFGVVILAWRRPAIRTRVLILSQRLWVTWLVPVFTGVILGCLAFSLYMRFRSLSPFLDYLPPLWIAAGAGLVVGVISAIVFAAVFQRFNRMDITASRCYYVVRKVDRLSSQGRYFFEDDDTRHAIRRESRILDLLDKQRDGCVKRRFLLRYTITPEKDIVPELKKRAADKKNAPAQNSNDPNKEKEDLTHEEILAESANLIWKKGEKRHWRAFGKRVGPLRFNKIFGNQLDDLFNGTQGFRIFQSGGPRFVTMVIKGPPGAGKSTLALQMCVSLACQGNFCMYYSLEEEREGLLKSAQSFGWDDPAAPPYDHEGKQIVAGVQTRADSRRVSYRGVHHSSFHEGRNQLKNRHAHLKKLGPGDDVHESSANSDGIVLVSSLGGRAMRFRTRMRKLRKVWGGRLGNIGDLPEVARCVVIDSLEGFANVGLEQEGQIAVPRGELLKLKDFFRDRCQMLIIVVEDDGSNKPGFVDFVADAVIQLGSREDTKTEYTILTVEILKARNQKHALGQHQIKIISKEDIQNATGPVVQIVRNLAPGIQVYPSLHYHLSLSARRETFDKHFLSTGLAGLDEMFNPDPDFDEKRRAQNVAGSEALIREDELRLRRPSATALLGPGGTAKSMIAMNFLIEGVRENAKTLLLSFRDDEGTVITRAIAQGPGRIRFAFGDAENHGLARAREQARRAPGKKEADQASAYYHQFQWALDDIVNWVGAAQRSSRLPYLFQQGPVSYENFQDDPKLQAEALAIQSFLRKLAESCPPNRKWDAFARARTRAAYTEAWHEFLGKVGQSLVTVEAGAPKTLRLVDDESVERPYLAWDSRFLDTSDKSAMKLVSNTELLQILALRPGNITPEDFVARILRVIGDTHEDRQYERVVFDDVSQLRHGFPLLANSQLLLRTLIDIFKAKGITSLFIADTEGGREDELDHGLADMSDHVLRTQVRYRTSDGSLTATEGNYAHRIIVIELEGRPGVAQQAPHTLKVDPATNTIVMERAP